MAAAGEQVFLWAGQDPAPTPPPVGFPRLLPAPRGSRPGSPGRPKLALARGAAESAGFRRQVMSTRAPCGNRRRATIVEMSAERGAGRLGATWNARRREAPPASGALRGWPGLARASRRVQPRVQCRVDWRVWRRVQSRSGGIRRGGVARASPARPKTPSAPHRRAVERPIRRRMCNRILLRRKKAAPSLCPSPASTFLRLANTSRRNQPTPCDARPPCSPP